MSSKAESEWTVAAVVALFVAAGLLEIGGGWLIWQHQREGKPWWFALLGAFALVLYGFVPTWQPLDAGNFGRVYAGYGCYFIILSLMWAWALDGQKPDTGDLMGCAFAVVGAALITFWPRD